MPAQSGTIPSANTHAGDEAQHWHDELLDGTRVLVRPLRADDAALEREFIEHLSPRSQRLRFLGLIGSPSDALVRQLTQLDFRREVAFAALVAREGEKHIIGVSRFSLGADRKSCECAVTVADEWQHKGLGTLLMRHLIAVARARGIHEMVSLDAVDNAPMRELAAYLGFTRRSDPLDASQVIHSLKL